MTKVNPIEYLSLEKIMKRHYGNSKCFDIDIGKTRCGKRGRKGCKNNGSITLKGKDNFYSYRLTLHRYPEGRSIPMYQYFIRIIVEHRESHDVIFNEDITNLNRLFQLLANKGKLLKDLADKLNMVREL